MAWFKNSGAARKLAGPGLRPPLLGGRYQMGQRLATGGLSQVFDGVDMRTGQPVAIKLVPLPADLSESQRLDWRHRLHREAAISNKLRHSDIVAVHDAGIESAHAWLVMERINGVDLGRYTHPDRLLPDALVLQIAARVAGALAHAHAHGVVHRDLKPANVLVDLSADLVKLADFGVARTADSALTQTGMTLGTPAYHAPEVLAGAECTPASDAYALGVLVYELLSARRPHEADTLGALLQTISSDPAVPLATHRPDLPPSVGRQVARLLAAHPEHRPHDLAAWAHQTAGLASVISRVMSSDVALRS